MIYVIAELTAKPGKQAALIAGAKPCIAATVKENGCVFYDLNQSVTDPDSFTFVERWTSREALEAHLHTPHLATWREVGKDCVATRMVEIISASHVETL